MNHLKVLIRQVPGYTAAGLCARQFEPRLITGMAQGGR
jgi:hypothetical protein